MKSPIVLGLLGGILILMSSKKSSTKLLDKKKPSEKTSNGYDIVFPCQTFEVFDEEKSYKFGYYVFSKLLDEQLEGTALNDLLAAYLNVIFGCSLTPPYFIPSMFEGTPALNPTYYTWGYRMVRVGLKAYSDLHKNTAEIVETCDIILNKILNEASKKGLVTAGLPTSVYGQLVM